jgi:hypothetical protein
MGQLCDVNSIHFGPQALLVSPLATVSLFSKSKFDQPLGETQVAALYAEYSKQALLYPHGAAGGPCCLFLASNCMGYTACDIGAEYVDVH